MPTYVLMTKLTPAALQGTSGRRATGHDWKARVDAACPGLRWIGHYALLGPYDFMDIYEAPDEETAFRVSLLSRENGALSAESWPAVAYPAFLGIADAVEGKKGLRPARGAVRSARAAARPPRGSPRAGGTSGARAGRCRAG